MRLSGYCSPCGECNWCSQRHKWHAELVKLRRWKRRAVRVLNHVANVLIAADEEDEQPLVRNSLKRIARLKRGA